MSFGAPWLLLGLFGALVPIIAHLFHSHSRRRIQLSSLRFVPQGSTTPQRRLQDRGLLFLRILAWIAIALSLADARCQKSSQLQIEARPHDALLVLDANARAQHRRDEQSQWDRQRSAALDLLQALPPGSRAALAFLGSQLPPQPFQSDFTTLQTRLTALGEEELEQSPVPGLDRQSAIAIHERRLQLSGLFEPSPERPKRIYYIAEAAPRGLLQIKGSWPANIEVIPVPTREAQNALGSSGGGARSARQIGIASLRVAPPIATQPSTLRIEATLENYGSAPWTEELQLQLQVDGQTVSTQRTRFSGREPLKVRWNYGLEHEGGETAGPQAARVRLVNHRDGYAPDDQYFFWLSNPKALQVGIVNGDPSEQRGHDEVYLLTTALRSAFVPEKLSIIGFSPEALREAATGDPQSLDDLDVLIMANVVAPSKKLARFLEQRVRAGMGLWWTVGNRVSAKDYNQKALSLLPLSLREASYVATQAGATAPQSIGVEAPRGAHPLWRHNPGAVDLQGSSTRRMFLLTPDPKGQAQTALAFQHGAPALLSKNLGQGKIALLTTTVDRDWSDLALRPGFVELVRATVAWLGQGRPGGGSLFPESVAVGAPLPIPAALVEQNEVRVIGPKGYEQKIPPTLPDTPAPPLLLPRAGHYRVEIAGQKGARIAANVDRGESPPPQPAAAQQSPRPQKTETKLATQSIPIWPYCVAFALLCLLLESVLRRRSA